MPEIHLTTVIKADIQTVFDYQEILICIRNQLLKQTKKQLQDELQD